MAINIYDRVDLLQDMLELALINMPQGTLEAYALQLQGKGYTRQLTHQLVGVSLLEDSNKAKLFRMLPDESDET